MRRQAALWVLLLLAVLTASTSSAQDQPFTIPLRVIDSEPLSGEELTAGADIVLYFNRPVDCNSAQTAFSLSPSVPGEVSCDSAESSLRFTPSAGYAPGALYTVRLNADLVGEGGSRLVEPFALQLNGQGFLQVSDVLPVDGTVDVAADSAITVIFNRPVVPLVIAEEAADLPSPITLQPAVEGSGEWLNTSIYIFRPTVALAGGTQYTVRVNPDLQAVDGARLQTPFAWSFTTSAPSVVEVLPEASATGVRLSDMIQMTFNQPMDHASVEASFALLPSGGAPVSGQFEWAEDSTGFGFQPDDLLQLDTVYVARLNPGAVSLGGGAPLENAPEWSFATIPPPSVIYTDPGDGAAEVLTYSNLAIYFASPMDVDTLADRVTIDPPPSVTPYFYYSDYNLSYQINFPMQPSTTYTITLEPGMADIYGNVISQARTFRFTTGALDPSITLQTQGTVGFYNANNTPTRLYLIHRNVSRLDFQLYQAQPSDFVTAVAADRYDPTTYLGDVAVFQGDVPLLRSWQIAVENDLNQDYYQLVPFSTRSAAVDCAGAPTSRLQVGDIAIVTSDPDPVRARAAAPDGEVLAQLYRDYQMPIIGGPLCANGLVWWQVRLRDEREAWVAEAISSDEYLLDVRIPSQTTPIEVTGSSDEALPPGVYLLRANSPETEERTYEPSAHVLVVATVNLTMKASVNGAVIWATDVQTGQPLSGVTVALYNTESDVPVTGVTDAEGLIQLDFPATMRQPDLYAPLVAVAQVDGAFAGMTYNNWSDGIEPYQFDVPSNYFPEVYRSYVYSDRAIYRPGQPVYFRGIIRMQDDAALLPPDFTAIPVQITNDRGETVYDETLSLTRFGTFSGTFTLAEDASLGGYFLQTKLPSLDPENSFQSTGYLNFNVAEFRLPEFQIIATPEASQVADGDTIRVTVESRYFFGGPVNNADVNYVVYRQPYDFQYDGPGFYSFFDYNDPNFYPTYYFPDYYGESIMDGSGTTDAQGNLTIQIPASLEDVSRSQMFTIEATITDESQQVVAGRTSVIVHQSQVYVGLRPESYVVTAGSDATINLLAVDWESQPVANQEIAVEVTERRWSNVQKQDESGRTTWEWTVEDIPVTTGSATSGNDGQADFTFTPPNGGIFMVKIRARDAEGGEAVASNTIWVAGSEYVSWRQDNSNRIDLVADQQNYAIGDTADILITSPFQGSAEALITVERGKVIQTERLTLTSNSYLYRLPITEDFAPNVFVSVMIVKGVDANNPVAAFRMGLVKLAVDNSRKVVNIAITPDQEQAGPGDTITYTVATTDYAGNPVAAEVGVSLTDLASLSLAEPNSGPLLDFYYGQLALSIRTSTPLTINVDAITQYVQDVIKGGGGGGGGGFGITEVREEFIDTAYWNATLTTGENGQATFSVTLPDNLTTWRLDARAVTVGDDGNTLVGQDTFDLISTRPLLIRPVTPRFFVLGDQTTVAAVVNNNTGAELNVEVTVQGSGLIFSTDTSQAFTIPSGGRQRVEWPVTVADVDTVDLTFFAEGGAFSDATKPTLGQGDDRLLPVYRYLAPETVGTAGLLSEAGTINEVVALPRRFQTTQGSLTLRLDQSLAATTLDGLEYLRNFEHQCIEQTVSRFLPNIMTFRALNQLGVADAVLRQQLEAAVNFAAQRLYAQQKPDGGWGWFVQEPSDPMTTAYALIGLAEARAEGFPIADRVIANARDYLQTQFIVPDLSAETWRLNRQVFILYALARSGAPDVARTANLYDARERLDLYAKALLALTFNLIDPASTERSNTLLSDLFNSAVLSATGASWQETTRDYWNWNTDTRTTAIVLSALVKLAPQNDLLPGAVRWLMSARTADAWETTQETAWAIMALTDWMAVSGELDPAYDFSATLNGDSLAQGTASADTVQESQQVVIPLADLARSNDLLIDRSAGAGNLYYTAHLTVALPVDEIEPLSRGISLERRYLNRAGETVTEARVGEVIQVRLTVIAPNDLNYVVITDPLPAGTEGINPELLTEQQLGTQPQLDSSDPLSQGWGWWFFSNIDFRDQQVNLYSTYLPAGTYEYVYSIRATLPGVYNVIPPTGGEFYFPEVYGRGAGSLFTVLPLDE